MNVKVIVSARVLDAQVGGNTRYARQVYAGLSATGIDYAAVRPPTVTSRFRSLSYAVYEGIYLPLNPPKDGDVLHYPADTGPMVPSRCPIVGTIHGLATLHVKNVRARRADRIWRARVHRLALISKTVITVSNSSARDVASLDRSIARKVVVIPHGIDHEKFNPEPGPGDTAILAALEIEEPYFLYVGNLDPRKNLIELCKAANEVFAATGVALVVAGAPAWLSEASMAAVQRTRGVRFLGRVSDEALIPLIQGALAFCFPSKYEGFGFPVIEAMACGTPVLCSNRGSLAEVAGDAALFVQNTGHVAIATEMLRMVKDDDLRRDLRARGLVNAQRFHWDRSIQEHARVFEQAAG